jgi:hypothetical protein
MSGMNKNKFGGSVAKKITHYRDGKRYTEFDKNLKNGCLGKQKFKNLRAAERFILRKFPEEYTLLPYKCLICNKYHIGHSKRDIDACCFQRKSG